MVDPLLRDRLRYFLQEDLSFGDTTTELVVEPRQAEAVVFLREDGVVAGIAEARELLEMYEIQVTDAVEDGSKASPGPILRMKGLNRSILMVERTLLNLIARMSGVATLTSEFVEVARAVNPNVRIAATRKTGPGLRWFDKRAVALAGGDTHRLALHDSILIKNNHVAAVGDILVCIERAKSGASFMKRIEVEVGNCEDALRAARAGVDVVMLDNMPISEMKRTLAALEREGLREKVLVEASGNITLDNVCEIAATGVDVISVGALTHSPKSLDVALRIVG